MNIVYLFEITVIGYMSQLLMIFFSRNNIYHDAKFRNTISSSLLFIANCFLVFSLLNSSISKTGERVSMILLQLSILYILYTNYTLRKTKISSFSLRLFYVYFVLSVFISLTMGNAPRLLSNLLISAAMIFLITAIFSKQDTSKINLVDLRINNLLLVIRCTLNFWLYRFVFFWNLDASFLLIFLCINMCDLLLLFINNQFHQKLLITSDLSKITTFKDSIHILNEIIENTTSSIVLTDLHANILFINQKAIELTGYNQREVIGQNPRIFASGKTSPDTYHQMWFTLANNQSWSGELVNKKKSGELYVESLDIIPIKDHTQQSRYYLAVKYDVTLQKSFMQTLQYHYDFDELTGAYRRPKYIELITANFQEKANHTRYIGMIDLDDFKTINDTYGHHVGDLVLIDFVQIVQEKLGDRGFICRMGGDEFSIYLKDESHTSLHHFIDSLEKIINTHVIHPKNCVSFNYKASFGMIEIGIDDSIEEKMIASDKLLYQCKQNKLKE